MDGGAFYSELQLGFDSIGAVIRFDLELTENRLSTTAITAQYAFALRDTSGSALFPTADPLGLGALFAVDISGASGGELMVFRPMEFVAPDSIVLNDVTTAVDGKMPTDRLRIVTIGPNPTSSGVILSVAVPSPGGTITMRVFDVLGRVVATPCSGRFVAGQTELVWTGLDRGNRRAPPGVYLVNLEMSGQSLVRRIVVKR